jgi:hypothetical protein
MTTAFKKGQEVFRISDWDRKGSVSIRRLTVQAWGKKIARFTYTENGQFIESSAYVPCVNHIVNGGGTFYFPVEGTNVEAEAFKLAELILQREREHFAQRLSIPGGSESYHRALQNSLNELHEPRIIWG